MSALDLAELAEQVATAIPRPDGDGVLLALVTYRRLARGAPVRVDALASEAGLPPSRAREILTACEVAFDEPGAIVGFGGLSLTPTAHRFEVDGVGLYTWCAWDALFLPPLLGKPGRLTTTCPGTRQQIHVVITPDRVESVQPSTAVMSFLPPTCCGADIMSRFCHFVLVFASAQAGDQWTANHPGTFLLSIAEAFELGGLVNTARYGPLTASRRTDSMIGQKRPSAAPPSEGEGPSAAAIGGVALIMGVCCLASTVLAAGGGLAAVGAALRSPSLLAGVALLALGGLGIARRRRCAGTSSRRRGAGPTDTHPNHPTTHGPTGKL